MCLCGCLKQVSNNALPQSKTSSATKSVKYRIFDLTLLFFNLGATETETETPNEKKMEIDLST